jgi:dihydrolipoamide dehydrogenase
MFDYLIIGAGPAGIELAVQARKRNLSVGLIEKDLIGGTCLHLGCIPTKALRNEALDHKGDSFKTMVTRVKEKISTIHEDTISMLNTLGVITIKGEAVMINRNQLKVGKDIFEAKQIVYAGGSSPITLKISGITLNGVYDSTTILNIEKIPNRIAIIGGGYIGLEWASIFLNLGSEVVLFEAQPEILLSVDEDIKRRLLNILKKNKFTLNTACLISSISNKDGLLLVSAGTNSSLVDVVLVAVGRKPISINIPEGVKAIGDASGGVLLAHKASMEAKAIFYSSYKNASIPSVIYTTPEIAMVGENEKNLKSIGKTFHTFKVPFRANSKSVIDEQTDGFIKLIVSEDKKTLLGAALIGHEVGEMLPFLTLAIDEKISIEKLKKIVFAHPTRSEIINSALEAIK